MTEDVTGALAALSTEDAGDENVSQKKPSKAQKRRVYYPKNVKLKD